MGNSPTYIPLPSLERWYEDRLVDLELSEDEVLAPEQKLDGVIARCDIFLGSIGLVQCLWEQRSITEFVGRDGYSIGLVQHVA